MAVRPSPFLPPAPPYPVMEWRGSLHGAHQTVMRSIRAGIYLPSCVYGLPLYEPMYDSLGSKQVK